MIIKFDIISDVNMTESIWSKLINLNKLIVYEYINYSSKFELKCQRFVDFIADNKHVQHALHLRHGTRQVG